MKNNRAMVTVGALSIAALFAATLFAGVPTSVRSTDVAVPQKCISSIHPVDRFDVSDWNNAVVEQVEEFASTSEPIQYTLLADSWALYGCWNPCKCPIHLIGEMYGGFDLDLIYESDELTEYAVGNVSWDVLEWRSGDYLYTVTGSGTYQVFTPADAEPSHRLVLTLVYHYDMFEDEFDSGEVPLGDSEALDITIANNNFYCLNRAFRITAAPIKK